MFVGFYVVDDGKIFHGSGVGDAFGPRCFKGDIMGCGIMFPRDYILDGEGEALNGHLLPTSNRLTKSEVMKRVRFCHKVTQTTVNGWSSAQLLRLSRTFYTSMMRKMMKRTGMIRSRTRTAER